MSNIVWLMAIAFALAMVVGYGFMKVHVPGGMLVGAMLVFATMQVLTSQVWIAPGTKEVAQVIAGCFIGASLSIEDLKRLPKLWKAFTVIVLGLIVLNISVGVLIASTSELTLITALFSTIPGGMSTIPIISEDYGADPVTVTVMQFIRMVMGIGVFPSLVIQISKRFNQDGRNLQATEDIEAKPLIKSRNKKQREKKPISNIAGLIIVAIVTFVGNHFLSNVNLMVIALLSMALLNLTIGVKPLPIYIRRIAQLLSGWYVGSQFYAEQFSALIQLVLPIVILVTMFLIGCLLIGYVVHKVQKLPLTDSLLASIPAGASDVVLILGDLNISNADIVVLQVLRVIVVTSLFPQIAQFVSQLF